MRYIFLLLLVLTSGIADCQSSDSTSVYLTFHDVPIRDRDIILLDELKDIKVVTTNDTKEYLVQFTIVQFMGDMLVFTVKGNEIKDLDIYSKLGMGYVPAEEVRYIALSAIEHELPAPVLYNAAIFTRRLETADDYFQECLLYAKIGERETTIWCIDQAIALDSTNVKYPLTRAQLFYQMGDFTAADEAFTLLLTDFPGFQTYYSASSVKANQGDFAKAKEYAEKALEYAYDDIEKSKAYGFIGDAYNRSYNYEEAYKTYKKALKLDPKNTDVLNNITTVLDEVGRPDEKVEYFERLLNVDSSYYYVHVNIGFYYLQKEQYDLALKEFEAVLEIEPEQAIALSNKAFVLMKLNELEDALSTINESIRLEPRNSYAYRNKGLILLEKGDSKGACEAFDEAINRNFTLQYGEEVVLLKEEHCKGE